MIFGAQQARRYWPYLVTGLVFVVSRWVYRNVFSVEFDTSPLDYYIQYIDPWYMEHDLLRSFWYLHNQGPLLNLLIAVLIRAFGKPGAMQALEALFLLFSFTTVMGLLLVARRLGARPLLACLVCSFYAASPTTVIYENWLFYHLPVALGLVLTVVALLHYHRAPSFWSAFGVFAALAVVALIRSTFGPLFLLLTLALLLVWPPLGERPQFARRTLVAAALGPLFVLCLNNLKPMVVLGYGYGDSFLYGNIAQKIGDQLPGPERERLHELNAVSPMIDNFFLTDLDSFRDLTIPHAPTGVPLLDDAHAPNGRANAHALQYLLLNQAYSKADARYLITHYPDLYLNSVREGLHAYTGSSLEAMLPGTPNYLNTRVPREALDRLLGARDDKTFPSFTYVLPLLIAYGVFRALRVPRPSLRGSATAFAVIVLMVVYVSAVAILISAGDYARYRSEVDPLFFLLFILLLSELRVPRFLLARARVR